MNIPDPTQSQSDPAELLVAHLVKIESQLARLVALLETKQGASVLDGFPIRMDREQAAAFLGVSVRTLEDFRKLGRLPKGSVIALPSASPSNVQPIYRYDRNGLQKFLDKCNV